MMCLRENLSELTFTRFVLTLGTEKYISVAHVHGRALRPRVEAPELTI